MGIQVIDLLFHFLMRSKVLHVLVAAHVLAVAHVLLVSLPDQGHRMVFIQHPSKGSVLELVHHNHQAEGKGLLLVDIQVIFQLQMFDS